MVPDSGVLNKILKAFNDQFLLGMGAITTDAQRLLALLATIEIILVALWWAYSGSEALGKLLKKTLFFCVFIGAVNNYGYLIGLVKDSFIAAGTKASGASTSLIEDPSGIVDKGIEVIGPLFDLAVASFGNWDFFDGIFLLITIVISLIAYFIMALQVLMVRLEFGLISTLGLILLPLGVFKHTSFLAEKVLGAILSLGVKLMVLAFVLSIAFPVIASMTVPANPTWYDQIYTVLAAATVAMLSLHAPALASGLLTGSPTLTAGSAASAAAIGAVSTAAVVAPAYMAAKGGVAAAGWAKDKISNGASATKAAASVLWNGRNDSPPSSSSPNSGPQNGGGAGITTANTTSLSSSTENKSAHHGTSQSKTSESAETTKMASNDTGKGDSFKNNEESSKGMTNGEASRGEDNKEDTKGDQNHSPTNSAKGADSQSGEAESSQNGYFSGSGDTKTANSQSGSNASKDDDKTNASGRVTSQSNRASNLITAYQVGSSLLRPTHPSGGTVVPINSRNEE